MTIAVVGAGIAGLACANRLQQLGKPVQLFDKARGPGGRMTSKRSAVGYIDLGAQYFTARHPAFMAQVQQWQQQGVVVPWLTAMSQFVAGKLLPSPDAQLRFVGVPAMHSPLRQLAQGLDIRYQCQLQRIWQQDHYWWLQDTTGQNYGPFSQLVLTVPPQQAAALLPAEFSALLPQQILTPCWAVDLQLTRPSGSNVGGIFVKDPQLPLSWLCRQNSKPGRASLEHWLLHFTAAFSQQHLEQPASFWQDRAVELLARVLARPVEVAAAICHRWRFAQIAEVVQPVPPVSLAAGLWLAGDWLRGGRVENAWLSGVEVAEQIQHD